MTDRPWKSLRESHRIDRAVAGQAARLADWVEMLDRPLARQLRDLAAGLLARANHP